MTLRRTYAHLAVLLALPWLAGGWTYCGSWSGNKTFNICLPEVSGSCAGSWSTEFGYDAGAWDGVIASPQFWQYTTPAYSFGADNGVNEASFSDHATIEAYYGPFDAAAIGVTFTWSSSTCGTYDENDVFLLVDYSWTLDRLASNYGGPYSFPEVAEHELGHVATLDHESGVLTIMNPSAHVVPSMLAWPHWDEIGAMTAHTGFTEVAREDLAALPYGANGVSTTAPSLTPAWGTVYPGDPITVDGLHTENWGTLGDRYVDITWVLSTDSWGTTWDTVLGTTAWSSLGFGVLGGPVTVWTPSVTPGWYSVIGVVDAYGAVADLYTFEDQVVMGSVYVGCPDDDGDGWTSASCGGGDCDDFDPSRSPSVAEVCDGRDQDCDGTVDDGVQAWWTTDSDGDGYGSDANWTYGCETASHDASVGGDCDDGSAAIRPYRSDPCDGVDQDCDGAVDEDDIDDDGDGWEDLACGGPDCDDLEGGVNPGEAEVCDGVDQNCDGRTDEGVETTFYADRDGDGYGVDDDAVEACDPKGKYDAEIAGDCDDGDPQVHPDRLDPCDGEDSDCDGQVDEDCTVTDPGSTPTEGGGATGGEDGEEDGDPKDPTDDGPGPCGCQTGPGPGWWAFAAPLLALARRRATGVARTAGALGLAAAVTVGLLGRTAEACTLPLTPVDLIGLSEVVVVGRVTAITVEEWGPAQVPVTRVAVEVDDVWKGAPADSLEVWQAGGPSESGEVMSISGGVAYQVGAELVLFLERSPSGVLVTAGLDQGAFAIDRGALVPVPNPDATTRSAGPSQRPYAGLTPAEARSFVAAHLDAPWPSVVPRIEPKVDPDPVPLAPR